MRLFGNYRNTFMNNNRRSNSSATASLAQNILSRGNLASQRTSSRQNSLLNGTSRNSRASALANTSNSKTAGTQKLYYNMKYHAGQVSFYAGNLADTEKDSAFAKAKESGDTAEVVSNIKSFVNQYNEMLSDLKKSGSRTEQSYLSQLNTLSASNLSKLSTTGVTRKADGTLSIDEKKLAATDIETLQSVWGSKGSFPSRAALWADSVAATAERNMKAQSSNAYSSLFNNNYGNSGNYFNFRR